MNDQNNSSISRGKIVGGFVIITIIIIVLGFVALYSQYLIQNSVNVADDQNRLIKYVLEVRQHEKNFIINGDGLYAEKIRKIINEMITQIDQTEGTLEEDAGAPASIKAYSHAFDTYASLERRKKQSSQVMRDAAKKVFGQCNAFLKSQKEQQQLEFLEEQSEISKLQRVIKQGADEAELTRLAKIVEIDDVIDRVKKLNIAKSIINMFLECRRHEKNFTITRDEKHKNNVIKTAQAIQDIVKSAREMIKLEINRDQIDNVLSGTIAYLHDFNKYVELTNKQKISEKKMVDSARKLISICETLRKNAKESMDSIASISYKLLLVTLIIGITFSVVLAYLIVNKIMNALSQVTANLTHGVGQIVDISEQVASSSQLVADSAVQQASSLGETLASLKEMDSMTKQNSNNANQVKTLVIGTSDMTKLGRQSMDKMVIAMKKIKSSSDETATIIKTIDEIAFQTNLLSLNAAVEAARTGEAGAGFAVVADEVRSLALRSAEAAKNTSQLIETVKHNVENGMGISKEVADLLSQIDGNVDNTTTFISEITSISSEQVQTIDQINSNAAQMDQATQNNAASAEEMAASAAQLSSNTNDVNDSIAVLSNMTGVDDNDG